MTDNHPAANDDDYRALLRDQLEDHVLRQSVVASVLQRKGPKGVTPDALQEFVKEGVPIYPNHGIYASAVGFFIGARALELEVHEAVMFGAEVAFGMYQRLGLPAERAETTVHDALDRMIAALESLQDKSEAQSGQGELDEAEAVSLFAQTVSGRMIASINAKEDEAFFPTDDEVAEFARLVVVS